MADLQPNDSGSSGPIDTTDVQPDGSVQEHAAAISKPHPGGKEQIDDAAMQAAQESIGRAAGMDKSEVPAVGFGVEGEFDVWVGRYSLMNFIGRSTMRLVATALWIVLAYYAWGRPGTHQAWAIFAMIAGGFLLLYWLYLLWQVMHARMSHYYRLTNKRLFVETGVFKRRIDQVELMRVNDVYLKHFSILSRLLGLGTVVVESSEESYPITYLTGVSQSKDVMDTVWHSARSEREQQTVRVDSV